MRYTAALSPGFTRRQFLVAVGAVGGGLAVGFRVSPATETESPGALAANPIDSYVRIAPDSTVTVLCAHMEGGQGAHHGMATLVADELDASWAQMRVEGIAGNAKLYGNLAWGGAIQGTGGSTAMASSWDRYRQAGAAARVLLVQAAAQQWDVAAEEITIENGTVQHSSGKRAGFGELADAAAKLPVPADVQLKDAKQWVYIGNTALRRLDTPAKTQGQQNYTIDVQLPGMLTAVLARPPLFGAQLKSVDASKARKMAGVKHIVETPRGVAVVAKDYWTALQARELLTVNWDLKGAETRSSTELFTEYQALATAGGGLPAQQVGDTEGAIKQAKNVVEAEFAFPYLAHAAMEPLNAVARFREGTLEIWAGHQLPDLYQATAAKLMGLPPEKVQLHVMSTGGFFGRRATPDADVIVEAVSIAKALGDDTPVKVQWTREDDTTAGRYRPMYCHHVKAGIDEQGKPLAWQHSIVGQSILAGTPFESFLVHNGVDDTSVEGAKDMPYAIPNLKVELVTTKVEVPVLWWRAVGHTHTAYAVETMIDELAHAANQDPLAYRQALLREHPRHLGVLKLAAAKAGWGNALAAGSGRGIAVHKSFNTYVAHVAEVSVSAGKLKVDRVVCAVDCGIAVNPDVIKAQMEGSIGFGLGALLYGDITLDGGRVVQTNFDSYAALRIDEMPAVEVHIVTSAERPTGVGEPGVPPLAPAVANAIYAATGKRIHRLPLGDQLTA